MLEKLGGICIEARCGLRLGRKAYISHQGISQLSEIRNAINQGRTSTLHRPLKIVEKFFDVPIPNAFPPTSQLDGWLTGQRKARHVGSFSSSRRVVVENGKGGNSDGTPEPADEDTIKQKLRSHLELEIRSAVIEIDRRYRIEIAEWLRWKFPRMSPADLAAVWNAVLLAVYRMALRRTITDKGRLTTLLHSLAIAQAAELWRRRPRLNFDGAVDVDELGYSPGANLNELVEALRAAIDTLPEPERQLFTIRLDFSLFNGRPPTLEELAAGKTLSLESIKGHLQRGRDALRKYFADERGQS